MMSKTHSNNENVIQNVRQLPNKNGDSCRKHQIKKQVFGEIKNVIHNQGIATPLKQDSQISKGTSNKYLANNIRSKLHMKNESKCINSNRTQKANSLCNSALDENNLLDYFDFRGQCCSKPYKSDQQIWSEMNLYDDSFLDKIIDDQQIHRKDDLISEVPNMNDDDDSDQEYFDELKDELNHNYWPDKNFFEEESDIHLYLEKPSVVADFTF